MKGGRRPLQVGAHIDLNRSRRRRRTGRKCAFLARPLARERGHRTSGEKLTVLHSSRISPPRSLLVDRLMTVLRLHYTHTYIHVFGSRIIRRIIRSYASFVIISGLDSFCTFILSVEVLVIWRFFFHCYNLFSCHLCDS